jgi:hypothetical protein
MIFAGIAAQTKTSFVTFAAYIMNIGNVPFS